MTDFPWTLVPGRLKEFLGQIPSTGIPDKVTQNYLEKTGYKSRNDRMTIGVLKDIGFTDSSGHPTARWKAYRDRGQSTAIMAQALRETYADLFGTYPDAHRKDNEALRNYFSAHSSAGDRMLQAMVQTFKALSELADFETAAPELAPEEVTPPAASQGGTSVRSSVSRGPGLTININVQIAVPETDKTEVYDKFFEALRKHLLP